MDIVITTENSVAIGPDKDQARRWHSFVEWKGTNAFFFPILRGRQKRFSENYTAVLALAPLDLFHDGRSHAFIAAREDDIECYHPGA